MTALTTLPSRSLKFEAVVGVNTMSLPRRLSLIIKTFLTIFTNNQAPPASPAQKETWRAVSANSTPAVLYRCLIYYNIGEFSRPERLSVVPVIGAGPSNSITRSALTSSDPPPLPNGALSPAAHRPPTTSITGYRALASAIPAEGPIQTRAIVFSGCGEAAEMKLTIASKCERALKGLVLALKNYKYEYKY